MLEGCDFDKMIIKLSCPVCGDRKVLRVRVHVNVKSSNTELDHIEIVESLDEDDFLRESLEPLLVANLAGCAGDDDVLKLLRTAGLSGLYAGEILQRLKRENRLYPGGQLLICQL